MFSNIEISTYIYYKSCCAPIERYELKLDKKNPQYWIQMAKSQFALYTNYRNEIGQIYIDNAIEYNKKAIELYKHSAQSRLLLASFYWNANMNDKALETMEEALKYDKFNKYYNEYYFQLKNSQ